MLRKVFALSLFAMMAATVSFASWTQQVVADIPFDFQVAGKLMPAGQYAITPVGGDGAMVMISHRFRQKRAVVLAAPANQKLAEKRSEIVFRRYGDLYHMVQIRHRNMNVGGRAIPVDKELWSKRSSVEAPVEISLTLPPAR